MKYSITLHKSALQTMQEVLPHVLVRKGITNDSYFMLIDNEEDYTAFRLAMDPSHIHDIFPIGIRNIVPL